MIGAAAVVIRGPSTVVGVLCHRRTEKRVRLGHAQCPSEASISSPWASGREPGSRWTTTADARWQCSNNSVRGNAATYVGSAEGPAEAVLQQTDRLRMSRLPGLEHVDEMLETVVVCPVGDHNIIGVVGVVQSKHSMEGAARTVSC